MFVPVGVLELSVKSSSFRANVKAFSLALSPGREDLSLTSFSQNCFNILICSCYLFRSIFFHVVQILYSDIDKKHRYFYFLQLWAKDVGAGLWWKPKVSLTIESFEDIPTENIFMHIFISLHFFTIVGQIAELSYFAFRTMEWTEDHDVLLLREILASDLFSFKKGSVARGERWESIAETWNEVKTLSFHLKDKRAVRDRWVLLQKKYKAKMHQEETASGISVDEMSEVDVLLEELVGKEESLNKVGDA